MRSLFLNYSRSVCRFPQNVTVGAVALLLLFFGAAAADLLGRPLADIFLHIAIVPANAYQRTKFQLSSAISFGDMRGSQNKKWELLIFPDAS